MELALDGLVAAALGAEWHTGQRGGRHPAARLAVLAGLAQACRPREREGGPRSGGRRRPSFRLRPKMILGRGHRSSYRMLQPFDSPESGFEVNGDLRQANLGKGWRWGGF